MCRKKQGMLIAAVVLTIAAAVIGSMYSRSDHRSSAGRDFKYEYGVFIGADSSSDSIREMKDYRIVVIDADTDSTGFDRKAISRLHDEGHIVYTYLNVGAVENYRSYYDEWKGITLGEYENWPDERWVDVSDRSWQDFVADRLAAKYTDMGVDGFFCDNCDVYYNYKTDEIYSGLLNIMKRLRSTGKAVVINGGDEFGSRYMKDHSSVTDVFTAVNQESVYSSIRDYDGSGKFGRQSEDTTEYYEAWLRKAQKKGAKIYLLEYTRDRSVKSEIIKKCAKDGWEYYISRSLKLK